MTVDKLEYANPNRLQIQILSLITVRSGASVFGKHQKHGGPETTRCNFKNRTGSYPLLNQTNTC